MKRRRHQISTLVDIDVEEVLEELTVEELLAALEEKWDVKAEAPPAAMDLVREAYEELSGGRSANALAFLERALFPVANLEKRYSEWKASKNAGVAGTA